MTVALYKHFPSEISTLVQAWSVEGPYTYEMINALVNCEEYKKHFSSSGFADVQPGETPNGLDFALDQHLTKFSIEDLTRMFKRRKHIDTLEYRSWHYYIWLWTLPRVTLKPDMTEEQIGILERCLQPNLDHPPSAAAFVAALRSNFDVWQAYEEAPLGFDNRFYFRVFSKQPVEVQVLKQLWDWVEETPFKSRILMDCWKHMNTNKSPDH